MAALAAVSAASDDDIVLLHDAARPLVSPATVSACVSVVAVLLTALALRGLEGTGRMAAEPG